MNKKTRQINIWRGEFGKEYTLRNELTIDEIENYWKTTYGYYRTELNEDFIGSLDRKIRILEVGCNIGHQLICLQYMGFKSLYGIEIQDFAIELSKSKTKNINIIQGSAFDIPFKDGFFDLIFTTGLLIHIAPTDINDVLNEIYRCTKKYIWGFEYYAETYKEIMYYGKNEMLWKTNFSKLFLDKFNDLSLIKEKKYKHLNNDKNIDLMFLLKKVLKS